LLGEAQASVEAALAPAEFVGLLKAGEALGYREVCDLLEKAVQPL